MNTFTEEESRECMRVHEWMYKLDNGLVNPIRELMDREDKILDLEAQVKSLSDILAEKDHKIMDLEAALAEYQREKHA